MVAPQTSSATPSAVSPSPLMCDGVRRRLARELRAWANRRQESPPPTELRQLLAALWQQLGLLKEQLTVRKIRDRGVAWKLTAECCEFSIERHPAGHIVWQTWRFDVASGRLHKLTDAKGRRHERESTV